MKRNIICVMSLLLVTLALCGFKVLKMASFNGTGTSAAAVTVNIPAGNGYVLVDSMYVTCETNASMTVRRPKRSSKVYASVSAATNIVVFTKGSNTVDGFSPTVGTDAIIVYNKTSGYQYAVLDLVTAYGSTTNITSYNTDAAITASADDIVYIVDITDNITWPCLSGTAQVDVRYPFTGFDQMPVQATIPATAGAVVLGGVYSQIK